MLNRREFLASVAVGVLSAAKPLKATSIDHISYQSVDYKKTRDFYVEFLGFQVSDEDNQQLYLWAGDMIISAKNTPRATSPLMDHYGFTLEPWNYDAVVSALKERGLSASVNRGNDPHDPPGMSVFTRDANGYPTQLCSPALETRPTAGPSRAPLKASGLHHLSYQCLDYKKARDFY